jgi:hypothetical protein
MLGSRKRTGTHFQGGQPVEELAEPATKVHRRLRDETLQGIADAVR